MALFEERVHILQQENKLVVLRRAGGAYAARVLDDLVKNYTVVDLALPSLRLQVEQEQARYLEEHGALPDPEQELLLADRTSMPFED